MLLKNRFAPLLTAAAAITASGSAHAASYYWDTDGTTTSATTQTGTWSAGGTTLSTDSTGASATSAVTTTTSDFLAFSAGTNVTGVSTVTVSGTQSIGGLTFEEGAVTLTGGTIAFGAVNGAIAINATDTIINSAFTGSAGMTKTGTGKLTLGSTPGYSGTTTINDGTLQFGYSSGFVGPVVINSPGTLILTSTAQIVGSSSFTLSGDGALVIGGTNGTRMILQGTGSTSYTGDITIKTGSVFEPRSFFSSATGNSVTVESGGELRIQFDPTAINALNGVSGSIVDSVSGAATLTVGKSGGTGSFSGTMKDNGSVLSLSKTGAGTQEFSGANITYTGATNINNGTLKLTNATAFNSAITFGATNTEALQLNNTTGTPWVFAKAIAGGSNSNVTLEKMGTGVVTLNSVVTGFTGGVKVSGGTLLFSSTTDFSSNTAAPTVTVNNGGVFGGVTSVAKKTNVNVTVNNGGAIQSDGAATGQLVLNNLTLGAAGTDTATIYGTLKAGFTPITVSTLTTAAGTIALTISGSSLTTGIYDLLTYTNGSTGTATFSTGSRAYTAINDTLNKKIQISYDTNASVYWTGAASGNWNTADTNWKVSGNNADTQFLANDIVYFHDISGTPSASVTINGADVNSSSATFDNTGTTTYTLSGDHGISTGSIAKTGSGTLNINNINTTTGAASVSGGTVNIAQGARLSSGAVALTGGMVNMAQGDGLGTGVVTFGGGELDYTGASTSTWTVSGVTVSSTSTIGVTNASGNLTYAGTIGGTGSLTKSGAGTLLLSGNSNYSGGTTVSAGTLQLNAATSAGTGTITLNDANTGTANTTLVLGNSATDTGFNNNITVAAFGTGVSTIKLADIGVSASGAGTITLNRAATIDGSALSSQYYVSARNFAGSGALTIGSTNGKWLILTGSGTAYSGDVTVNSGAILEPRTTFDGRNFTVNGTLQLNGNSSINALNGSGSVTQRSNAAVLTVGNGDGGGNFTGVIGGGASVALTKTGAGTQILSGAAANTYSGGTTISGGVLVTDKSAALGAGSVSLGGGTLQIGNGAVNQLVITSTKNITTTAATASVLKFYANLGADTGSGAPANLTLSGGGKYDFSAGSLSLDLNDQFNTAGTYHLIAGGTSNVDASSYTLLHFDNLNWSANFANGDLVVTAVPEPSTYGLIGAGTLAAVAFVRRRRKFSGA